MVAIYDRDVWAILGSNAVQKGLSPIDDDGPQHKDQQSGQKINISTGDMSHNDILTHSE